jgi:ArsR family transcriptional regulator, lead/cadmium/zinc/bismuth-responsive transcriptional repressor
MTICTPAVRPTRVVHPDRIENARRDAFSDQELARMAQVFKLLGDPSRLKIVLALRRQEMCVCDLAVLSGISESAVSHQLRRLKDLDLVRSRRNGQVIYYSLDDKHVALLLDIALRHIREQ